MNSLLPKMLVPGYYGAVGVTTKGDILAEKLQNAELSRYYECFKGKLITGLYSCDMDYVLATTVNGEILSVCNEDARDAGLGQSAFRSLKGDINKIVCESRNVYVIYKDGTVAHCGENDFNQSEASNWTDIVDIATETSYVIGLRKDGTVVACGCDVWEKGVLDVSGWTDICGIACGDDVTFGIKKDGTVLALGENEHGQRNVNGWTDIVKIVSAYTHTIGLKKDGTVVACGENAIYDKSIGGPCDVAKWTDVIDIACTTEYTVGLRKDGSVLFTGYDRGFYDILVQWKDIVHVVANTHSLFGIKKDGTIVHCGMGDHNFDNWKLFDDFETIDEVFEETINKWKNSKGSSGNSSSSNSGGCYVATCVYGSYDCPPVWTLRRYRDFVLAKTVYGRALIKIYYAVSPTLVKWFGNTEWFKTMWKAPLDKLVSRLNSSGIESTSYKDSK